MPSATKPIVIELDNFVDSVNLLIHGFNGCGKSVFGGSGGPKSIILSCEPGGTISARRAGGSRAKLVKCPTWKDLENALKWWEAHPEELNDIEWVTLDSGTKAQMLAVRDILAEQVAQNSKRNPDIPAIQDHQEWQNRFKRFIDRLCDLPVNVCILAGSFFTEDREGDEQILPAFEGKHNKIAYYVGGAVNVVGYMEEIVKGDERVYRINFDKNREALYAKDRLGGLAPFKDVGQGCKDFNLTTILAIEKGRETKPATPTKAAARARRRRTTAN